MLFFSSGRIYLKSEEKKESLPATNTRTQRLSTIFKLAALLYNWSLARLGDLGCLFKVYRNQLRDTALRHGYTK